jgi:hypothetical protein
VWGSGSPVGLLGFGGNGPSRGKDVRLDSTIPGGACRRGGSGRGSGGGQVGVRRGSGGCQKTIRRPRFPASEEECSHGDPLLIIELLGFRVYGLGFRV